MKKILPLLSNSNSIRSLVYILALTSLSILNSSVLIDCASAQNNPMKREAIGTHEGFAIHYATSSSATQDQNTTQYHEIQIALPKSSTPHIFKLKNPDRLVVDLANLRLRQNRTFNLREDQPIKNIRMGIHPDRVRLVIDLISGMTPEYRVSSDGKLLTLHFGQALNQAPAQMATRDQDVTSVAASTTTNTYPSNPPQQRLPQAQIVAATKQAPTKQGVPTNNAEIQSGAGTGIKNNLEVAVQDMVKPIPSRIPQHAKDRAQDQRVESEDVVPLSPVSPAKIHADETVNSAPKARVSTKTLITSEELAAASTLGNTTTTTVSALNATTQSQRGTFDGLKVTGIDFTKESDKTPMIKITLSQKTPYTLMKTGQRAYRLTIPNGMFAQEHLTLPHFPPQDFSGITLINPEKGTGQVEFFIGVDRNVKLSSFANQNEIWIKVAKDS